MKCSKILKGARISGEEYLVGTENPGAPGNEEEANRASAGPEAAGAPPEALPDRWREGFEAGQQMAQTEAAKKLAQEREAQQRWAEKLDETVRKEMERMEAQMVDLAVAVAKKITGETPAWQPELIRRSLKKVLGRHSDPGELMTVRVNPEDYRRVAPSNEVMPKNLRLLPDPAVACGGCLLETQHGSVDARLETQLQELEQALRDQAGRGATLAQLRETAETAVEIRAEGRVVNVVGTVIESRGPNATVGEQCEIFAGNSEQSLRAEVIGFRENRLLLMPLGEKHGIGPGSRVVARGQSFTVQAGSHLLGRILNGMGQPIDNRGPLPGGKPVSIHAQPNNPMQRKTIVDPLYTGVRALDGLLTSGKGGRMGIFAGSGVGKSVLLGMMARHTQADVNVIALVGERGREVREFVENDLGEEGLRRSVVIAVTSDESPILRVHGAKLAATIAEYFAGEGKDVLFMMDSVTRFAMAQREIGLAAGEPPTTKGYPPSTFAALPKLLERSGIFQDRGSITGFYTVLVEGDDLDEPVADHVRSILDGHVVLSRALFSQNQFPAIDVLQSISRLAKQVVAEEHQRWAGLIRDQLATLQEAQDLVNIGAYARGSNPKIDRALEMVEEIRKFLRQPIGEKVPPEEVWKHLGAIAARIERK